MGLAQASEPNRSQPETLISFERRMVSVKAPHLREPHGLSVLTLKPLVSSLVLSELTTNREAGD